MSDYQAQIRWNRHPDERFVDFRYSRAHEWTFDGGVTIPASSAAASVPLPYSKLDNVDPEEAFVATIASCHMLTFLSLAAKASFVVDSYDYLAVGTMSRNASGKLAVTTVRLTPEVVFSGAVVPSDAAVDELHRAAHAECYIANSVLTDIFVTGTWQYAAV